MDRCKLFNLALIISCSLVLVAALITLSQAAPATAATWVTTLYETESSLDLESISPMSSGPGLALPPSLPRKGPLLQESPVLTITKSADPNPVNAGQVLTYTIVVVNSDDANATGVVITDVLDSEVRFAGASNGGSHSSGVVTWDVTEIEIGQTISCTLWVTVTDVASGTILSNTAWVTPTDGINNSDTITTTVTTAADLQIAKSASVDPAVAGTSFTYAITVTNNGPSVASGVTVTDALPLGLTFDTAGSSPECSALDQNVTCDIRDLLAGDEVILTIAVSADAALADGATLTNTASVSGNESDPITDNDSAQEETTVNRQTDLQVTKSASADPVVAGTSFAYTITVTNNGPSVASGVTVTDALPLGLTFDTTGSSPECSALDQNVTCDIGNLLASDEVILTIAVSADAALADGATLTNTASVSGNESDPIADNDSAQEGTTVNRQADLQIAKSASVDPVVAGTSFAYTITVTNNGHSLASGVTVTDALPLGLTFNAAGSSPECSALGQNVTCTLGALSVNGQMMLAIAVTVDTSLEDGVVLSNTASASGHESDPNESDNSATEETLVERNKIFLPILLKPQPTELSVFNDNTGDNITFVVLGTPVSCVVPNNTTQFCGTLAPGTYQIRVTSTCGEGLFTKTYGSGPVTTRVFCR